MKTKPSNDQGSPSKEAQEWLDKIEAAEGDVRDGLLDAVAAEGNLELVREIMTGMRARNEELRAQNEQLRAQHDALLEELRRRGDTVAYLRRLLFGRRSEKLKPDELGQLLIAYGGEQPGEGAAEPLVPVPPLEEDVEPEERPRQEPNKRRKHPGRTALSSKLERVVIEVAVAAGERQCLQCGAEMACIGHLEHERVEHVPARFVVHVQRREKLACKACKGDATTADKVESSAVKTRVGASVLALLIESKCDDALPIHRQCDQFSRLGFDVPVNTLYGYWRYVTDLLRPVSDALVLAVLDDPSYVGIDDTGIDVLDRGRARGTYLGHLWCFRGSRPWVAYAFTETWKAEEIAPWIHTIPPSTFIQVDDYKGYSAETSMPDGRFEPLVAPERRLGCMMHVRRRFHAALELGDKRAAFPIAKIRELYEIESEARGASPEVRLALRRQRSLPILDELDRWVDERDGTLGKTGKLAEAVRYAKQQRAFIRRCFSDGRFEVDNGAVERAIREPALGRKNFLFTGSTAAARRLAAAYSLVQTCRALGISTRDYLIDVIEKIEGGWPMQRLGELLPHCWAAHRGTEGA